MNGFNAFLFPGRLRFSAAFRAVRRSRLAAVAAVLVGTGLAAPIRAGSMYVEVYGRTRANDPLAGWSGIYFDNVWLYDSGVTIDGPTDVGAVQYPNSAALTAFESKLKAVKWFVTFEFDDPGFAMGEVFQDPGGRNYVQVIPLNTPARKCYNEVRSALSKPSIAGIMRTCFSAGPSHTDEFFAELQELLESSRTSFSPTQQQAIADNYPVALANYPPKTGDTTFPSVRILRVTPRLRSRVIGTVIDANPYATFAKGNGDRTDRKATVSGTRFTCPVSGRGSRVSVVVTALDTAMNKTVARKTVRIRG
jgi:hypothetical protein